jgi:hypothetical protein
LYNPQDTIAIGNNPLTAETMQAVNDRKAEAKQESGLPDFDLPVYTVVRDGEGKCHFCSKEGLLEIVYFFHKDDAEYIWPPGQILAQIAIHAEAWKAGRLHRNPGNGDPCGLGLAVLIKSFYRLHAMDADSYTARFYSLFPAKTTRSGRRYHLPTLVLSYCSYCSYCSLKTHLLLAIRVCVCADRKNHNHTQKHTLLLSSFLFLLLLLLFGLVVVRVGGLLFMSTTTTTTTYYYYYYYYIQMSKRKAEAKTDFWGDGVDDDVLSVSPLLGGGEGKCDYCSKEGPLLSFDFNYKKGARKSAKVLRVGHVSIHHSACNGDPCGLILAGILKSFSHLDGMCVDNFTARFYKD